ncbi:uncharacterized protein [Phaseolus vulgaris]|uniref:uncharacterized protein n=1 Tax=Phaseolus vulgaris TaxID=3885 RepID=UPI0035CABF38
MPNYYWWTNHGEELPQSPPVDVASSCYGTCEQREELGHFHQMIMDHVGPSNAHCMQPESVIGSEYMEENPDLETRNFFNMLAAAQAPLWEGCENHSELSASLEALSLKSDYNMSEGCFNRMVQLMGETMPKDHRMVNNFFQAKKLVEKLGLGCTKIDCCPKGCMLYYREHCHKSITNCFICGMERYKTVTRRGIEKKIAIKKMWYFPIIPRLRRLYSSMATAPHMRWHSENQRDPSILSHPSDGEAWKHFDRIHQDFSQDPRNVRLGLCADGFNPFGQYGKSYSCWPVILTPYNLPPSMCMKREFMFLTILVPGPSNPKHKIDVFLQPLIDDLCTLWTEGILTYDVSLRQNFMMKAALMWTINDFPAYGMLSGWMTSGRLSCPICMERTKAFYLSHSHKISFFDCHRQFLSPDHQFRKNKKAFKKKFVETDPPPPRLSSLDIWNRVAHLPVCTELQEQPNIPEYGIKHNWKKQSIFWRLPYWKTQLLRHNIDVMH